MIKVIDKKHLKAKRDLACKLLELQNMTYEEWEFEKLDEIISNNIDFISDLIDKEKNNN